MQKPIWGWEGMPQVHVRPKSAAPPSRPCRNWQVPHARVGSPLSLAAASPGNLSPASLGAPLALCNRQVKSRLERCFQPAGNLGAARFSGLSPVRQLEFVQISNFDDFAILGFRSLCVTEWIVSRLLSANSAIWNLVVVECDWLVMGFCGFCQI